MDFFKKQDNFIKYNNIKSNLIVGSKKSIKPFISIVIPTYNKHDMFKITLNSVLYLESKYFYDIIIVNDNPADKDLEKYIKNLNNEKIQYYVNEKNIGLFGNWNRCFELADGEWVSLLNDDDYLYSNYLKEIEEVLTKHKEIQYLYIAHDIVKIKNAVQAQKMFKNKEKQAVKQKKSNHLKDIIKNGILIHPVSLLDFYMTQELTHPLGSLIRKDKFIQSGGYNETFYPSSDWIYNVNYLMKNNMYFFGHSLGCRSEGINVSSGIETKIKFIHMDYMFRNEMAKYLAMPFKYWYSRCLLNDYAKGMHVLNKIDIYSIKKCTGSEIVLYQAIRKGYINFKNIFNYLIYKKY